MTSTTAASGSKIVNRSIMSAKKYDPKTYGRLLADTLPGVIANRKEYDRTESIFNGLLNKGEEGLSPEESRLLELLANLLEDYERRTLPSEPDSTPAETLRFLMDQNGLKQSDLEDIFGSQAAVSKVLNGHREISKAQAKGLAMRFHMSTDAFI